MLTLRSPLNRAKIRLRRRYTPDFLVTYSGGTDLVEVKYASALEANWDRLAPAFSAAKQWANARNGRFRVVTEAEIRCGVLENAKRLLPLRALPLDPKMAMLALTRAHTLKGATFRTLVEALPDRTLALATLWRLIARGELRTDLSNPITLNSEFYPR